MNERAAAYASMKLRAHVHWEDPDQAGSDEYQRDRRNSLVRMQTTEIKQRGNCLHLFEGN